MAQGLTIQIEGASRVGQRLAGMPERTAQAAAIVLYRSAEEIITNAKRLVPVDLGHLRASGHVLPPEIRGGRIELLLGFGGPAGSGNQGQSNMEDVGYAVYVHEDLTTHHTVGQAKYLEIPVREALQTVQQQLAAATERALLARHQRFAKGEAESFV